MLSSSCLVLPAVVKQELEEISRNHVPSLFAVSVVFKDRDRCDCKRDTRASGAAVTQIQLNED